MKNIIILFLGIILIMQTGCSHINSKPEQDLKSIVDSLGNQAEQCFLNGKIDDLLEFYCDDIISMPNTHPMIKGKQNLKKMTETVLTSGMKFLALESTTIDAQADGSLVYEIGTFRQSILLPGSQEPINQTGKYITIWKLQPDGKLKIAVEIYNSDTPPTN